MADHSPVAPLPLPYGVGRQPNLAARLTPLVVMFAAWPVLFAAAFYGTWLAAWVTLGHRPIPSVDDPKFISATVSTLHNATGITMMLFPLSVIGLIVGGIVDLLDRIAAVRLVKLVHVLAILAAVTPWLGVIALVRFGPGDVGVWFMD